MDGIKNRRSMTARLRSRPPKTWLNIFRTKPRKIPNYQTFHLPRGGTQPRTGDPAHPREEITNPPPNANALIIVRMNSVEVVVRTRSSPIAPRAGCCWLVRLLAHLPHLPANRNKQNTDINTQQIPKPDRTIFSSVRLSFVVQVNLNICSVPLQLLAIRGGSQF